MDSKKIYKDSLFRDYFRDKENFAQLCNAVTGLNLKAEQFTENTVEDVSFSKFRNDVSFNAGKRCFIFFEQRNEINLNTPLQMLFYFSSIGKKILTCKKEFTAFPAPRFCLLYSGKKTYPEESTLKISDAFLMAGGNFELTVKVYNINYDKNFRLINECRPVHDYSCFIDRIETNHATGMSRDKAVIAAMKWCIENNIMRDYLKTRMQEVFMMVNLVWNEEDARKAYLEQGREEGERQTLLENVRNLMKNLKLSAEAAMNALGISPEMQKELAPLI